MKLCRRKGVINFCFRNDQCINIFVDNLLKRVKLVTERVYINLCKYRPFDFGKIYAGQVTFSYSDLIKFYVFPQTLHPFLQVYSQSYERKPTDFNSRWTFCSNTELLTPKEVEPFSFPKDILPPLLSAAISILLQ